MQFSSFSFNFILTLCFYVFFLEWKIKKKNLRYFFSFIKWNINKTPRYSITNCYYRFSCILAVSLTETCCIFSPIEIGIKLILAITWGSVGILIWLAEWPSLFMIFLLKFHLIRKLLKWAFLSGSPKSSP